MELVVRCRVLAMGAMRGGYEAEAISWGHAMGAMGRQPTDRDMRWGASDEGWSSPRNHGMDSAIAHP